MKDKYNILIVPAGSGMAIAAIQGLKKNDIFHIVAADLNPLAARLYLADTAYQVPSFDDEEFYKKLDEIIKVEDINIIIPALETILLDFSKKWDYYNKKGIAVLVSKPEAIECTRDKWLTYNKFKNKIFVSKSFIKLDKINIEFPLFIKPRDGSGSINVYKKNEKELIFFYSYVRNPIIQEYLPGKEYTIDCITDNDGNLKICIPRERLEVKAEISVKGKIIGNEYLHEMAEKITNEITFRGPFFFQAKEDNNGIPKLTEINGRIAGNMILSNESGIDFYKIAIKLILGEKIEIQKIR